MQHAVRFRKMAMERWSDDLVQKTACYTRFVEADWKELLKIKNPEQLEAEIEKMLAPGPIDAHKEDTPEEEKA
jgi:hypothetical protein